MLDCFVVFPWISTENETGFRSLLLFSAKHFFIFFQRKVLTSLIHISLFSPGCSHAFAAFTENWVILGVFYYPALYYPLLACGTLHNKVGYVLGSLLSWTHFGVLVWQKIDCPKTPLVSKAGFGCLCKFQGSVNSFI